MSARKFSVLGGVIVGVALLGFLAYQLDRSRRAEREIAALQRERQELRARLASAEQRTRQLTETLGANAKAREQSTAAVDVPAAAGKSGTPPSLSGPWMQYLFEHPELHAAFLQQQVSRVQVRFDRFFKMAGLSASEEQEFLKLAEEGHGADLDWMAALHARGYDLNNLPKDPQERMQLAKLRKEKAEEGIPKLRALLGEDRYQQLEQYSNSQPERNVADQLASQVYYTAEPLTAQQADQLPRF